MTPPRCIPAGCVPALLPICHPSRPPSLRTTFLPVLPPRLAGHPRTWQAVYHMPTEENGEPSTSIPLALQALFYKVASKSGGEGAGGGGTAAHAVMA